MTTAYQFLKFTAVAGLAAAGLIACASAPAGPVMVAETPDARAPLAAPGPRVLASLAKAPANAVVEEAGARWRVGSAWSSALGAPCRSVRDLGAPEDDGGFLLCGDGAGGFAAYRDVSGLGS